MREKLQQFMNGRYGHDQLNKVMLTAALILFIVSLITRLSLLYYFAIVLLIYCIFRMMSRNSTKRLEENVAFSRFLHKITSFFSSRKKRFEDRKTHAYYKCPTCRQQLRVPKGRGRISINCPKCHNSFTKTT